MLPSIRVPNPFLSFHGVVAIDFCCAIMLSLRASPAPLRGAIDFDIKIVDKGFRPRPHSVVWFSSCLQVIYALNTKNDEHEEEIESLKEAHEDEVGTRRNAEHLWLHEAQCVWKRSLIYLFFISGELMWSDVLLEALLAFFSCSFCILYWTYDAGGGYQAHRSDMSNKHAAFSFNLYLTSLLITQH